MEGYQTSTTRLAEALRDYLEAPDPMVPSDYARQIGDGDYRDIGAEFLSLVVEAGGLRASDRVLDLGCGLGRFAQPLKHFLDPSGSYLGLDVNRASIQWCQQNLGQEDPRFRFVHLDVHHPLYNPEGRIPATGGHLPVVVEGFDFVTLISVFTHLSADMTQKYLSEVHRVLKPGGRLFATFFLVSSSKDEGGDSGARINFDLSHDGPTYVERGDEMLAAVATSESWLDRVALVDLGFRSVATRRGHWRSAIPDPDAPYQDIKVFEK